MRRRHHRRQHHRLSSGQPNAGPATKGVARTKRELLGLKGFRLIFVASSILFLLHFYRFIQPIPEDNKPKWIPKVEKWRIDLVVPVTNQDDRLLRFSRFVGSMVHELNDKNRVAVDLRLIATRYPGDNSSREFLHELENLAHVPVSFEFPMTKFSRGCALNVLHAAACTGLRHLEQCAVAAMDVDMQVGMEFVENTIAAIWSNTSSNANTVYFPIVFSKFNNMTVKLVQYVIQNYTYEIFGKHQGLWRDFGYGMYAIPKHLLLLNRNLRFNDDLEGWGGEDKQFHQQMLDANITVIRSRDKGLIHVWHNKNCESSSFVGEEYKERCKNSRGMMEGSFFGYYLRDMKDNFCDCKEVPPTVRDGWRKGLKELMKKSIDDENEDDETPEGDEVLPEAITDNVSEMAMFCNVACQQP